jgi:hypothetical protein
MSKRQPAQPSEPTLFAWNELLEFRNPLGSPPQNPLPSFYHGAISDQCRFCGGIRFDQYMHVANPRLGVYGGGYICLTCGFSTEDVTNRKQEYRRINVSALREYGLNDAELPMQDLLAHLNSHFADVYTISPRRFEQVVEEVFRTLGYQTRLTQSSRDGGYDIVVVENSSGAQMIVECKRYGEGKTVGVGLVRHLLGVQLRENVKRAVLVTNSNFTQDAKDWISSGFHIDQGFEMDLWDGEQLSKMLAYVPHLLPDREVVEQLLAKCVVARL